MESSAATDINDATHPYALAFSFQERLRAMRDSDLKWENTREFNQKWKLQRRQQARFCREFLQELNTPQSPAIAEYNPAQVCVARVAVRMELAHHVELDNPEEAQDLLHDALDDAHSANMPHGIFKVLMQLGHFYRNLGYREDAIWYYQEALVYAQNDRPPDAANVLYWLGCTFAEQEETLSQAVFMYDWAARFGPWEFGALIEKYKCMLRMGQRESVIAEVSEPLGETCEEIASVVAALIALGRRKKALRRVASQGMEAAKQREERQWHYVFEQYAQI